MTEPGQNQAPQTLLVALAHPDDEVGMVATMQAQIERGDRVVLLWLTRGEMTEALGPIPTEDIVRRRIGMVFPLPVGLPISLTT